MVRACRGRRDPSRRKHRLGQFLICRPLSQGHKFVSAYLTITMEKVLHASFVHIKYSTSRIATIFAVEVTVGDAIKRIPGLSSKRTEDAA